MNLFKPQGIVQEKTGCYVCGEYHTGLTVRGLMTMRLKEAEKKAAPSSCISLRHTIERHIIPVLGDYEIDYLTEADIHAFLDQKRKSGRLDGKGGLSEKKIADIASVLNTAFALVKWDSPAGSGFVDAPHLKPLDEILTLEQTDILTRYLTKNLNRCNAGYLLCLYTGIKMSEACALRDSDFDLVNDRLLIRRTMQRATLGDQRESTFSTSDYPEDYYGNRVLKFQPKLAMLLLYLLRQPNSSGYFLSGKTTGSLAPRTFQERFKKLLPEAGLPDNLNFHMLRNTFAWMWLLRENDLEGLTYVMGFKSVDITKMTYSPLLKTLDIRLPKCAKYLSTK